MLFCLFRFDFKTFRISLILSTGICALHFPRVLRARRNNLRINTGNEPEMEEGAGRVLQQVQIVVINLSELYCSKRGRGIRLRFWSTILNLVKAENFGVDGIVRNPLKSTFCATVHGDSGFGTIGSYSGHKLLTISCSHFRRRCVEAKPSPHFA